MTSRAARAVLLLAIAASAWRFHALRHAGEFVDESAEMTTGWLLSEGETLYGSVFSHHMPLAAAIAHGVAAVSPTDRPAHFRAAPWAATVLLGLAVAFGPLGRRRPVAGAFAGAALLAVLSALAPLLGGHMLLNEVFWGIAFAISLLLVPLPVLLGEEPAPVDAFLSGAAAALAVAGSPLAGPPLLAAAGLALAGGPLRRLARAAAFAAAGAAAACALFGAWLARHADLAGFRSEVLRFNSEIYARFVGLTPDFVLPEMLRLWRAFLSGAARGAAGGDADALLVPALLGAVLLVALAPAVRGRAEGRREGLARAAAAATFAAALVFFLRMRDGGFHAYPLHVVVLAAAAVLPWAGGFRSPRLVSAAAAIVLFPALVQAARRDPPPPVAPELAAAARYVRAHTSPADRIAAFPTLPIVYLEAGRKPATDAIFYLPWQAMWEDRDPAVRSVCSQLRGNPPRYVVLLDTTIWGLFPWRSYAHCIDGFVRSRYVRLPDPGLGGLVWERRDEAGR